MKARTVADDIRAAVRKDNRERAARAEKRRKSKTVMVRGRKHWRAAKEFVEPVVLHRAFDQLGDVLFSEPGARMVPTKPPIHNEDLRGTFHVPLPLPPGMYIAGTLALPVGYSSGEFMRRPPPKDDAAMLRLARYALRNLHAKDATCGYDKMAAAVERAADCAQGIPHVKTPEPVKWDHGGWYTHGCGQWVHDKLCPCSVCPPKRKRKKK